VTASEERVSGKMLEHFHPTGGTVEPWLDYISLIMRI